MFGVARPLKRPMDDWLNNYPLNRMDVPTKGRCSRLTHEGEETFVLCGDSSHGLGW